MQADIPISIDSIVLPVPESLLGSDRASSKGYIVRWVEAPSNKLLTTAFEASLVCMSGSDPMKYNSYGGYSASVGIAGELLAGSLPQKQFRMLVGWLALHEEAYAAWNKAVRGEHFDKIELSQERAFTKYC